MFQHTPPSEASECSRALPAVRHPALPQAQILVFSQSSSSGTHSNTPTSGRYVPSAGGSVPSAGGSTVRQRFDDDALSGGQCDGSAVQRWTALALSRAVRFSSAGRSYDVRRQWRACGVQRR
ncbi:uncharacterized protein B0H18DRAFT_1051360, partial [Fomitopsis serialis]|uniref:uncharacterized protein n=1 Tax=Fomitopsis serialis TaxID=139415 RepID=UPI0020079CFE